MEIKSELALKDKNFIWHPFTQAKNALPIIPLASGKGVYLFSEEGEQYLDGISSWWVNLHGHSHPYIVKKIAEQAATLEHAIFANFTHSPAIQLAERLHQELTYTQKTFFSDNGSTAVEVALKMALQYWWNQSKPKSKIISFRHAYHGDTFGAMAAAGKSSYHRPFWPFLFDVEKIDPPIVGQEERSFQQLATLLEDCEVGCFIFEPLIQGSGGMKIHCLKSLDNLLALCRRRGIVTIADEVMTGFGRTGPLFVSQLLQNKPDIICLSKGITGGFLPLGATLCKQFIFDSFYSDEPQHALLHGHSYTGNPLACAAALASLDLLQSESCINQRRQIAAQHQAFVKKWKDHPSLNRCESLGTILVLEYRTSEPSSYFSTLSPRLSSFFLKNKIILRPLGNMLYVMPPYCILLEELQHIYDHIKMTLETSSW